MIVYQCIEAAGDQGIWIRDIKVQTSLHAVFDMTLLSLQSAINRAIEKMVKRKLIKSFKSIASKMKIMYILYDKGTFLAQLLPLELPKDITGGPWYVEQEFDLEFINVMSTFVQKVLREDVLMQTAWDIGLWHGDEGDSAPDHAQQYIKCQYPFCLIACSNESLDDFLDATFKRSRHPPAAQQDEL